MPIGANRGPTYTSAVPPSLGAKADAQASTPLISARGLSIVYPGPSVALDGVDLTIPGAGITCLLGANGAGKTSLLEAAAGLRNTTNGTLQVLGEPAGSADNRLRVGVMLQDGGLPGSARVIDFLRYVARLYPHPGNVEDIIDQVHIRKFTRSTIRRLSGGEAKRVAWAAALIGSPTALILDEPTAALDPVARASMHAGLRELAAAGVSMIIATHLLEDVEALADYIVVLRAGTVVAQGTPDELRPRNRVDVRAPAHLPTEPLVEALPPGTTCTEVSPGRYRVQTPTEVDPAVVSTVTSWCTQAGAAPDLTIADLGQALFEAIDGAEL